MLKFIATSGLVLSVTAFMVAIINVEILWGTIAALCILGFALMEHSITMDEDDSIDA